MTPSTADDIEVGCVICKCHPDCEECQATMFSADGPPLALCDCENDDRTGGVRMPTPTRMTICEGYINAAGRYRYYALAVLPRITLMGTEPHGPRCAWCAHPLDAHGAYGCDTDDCRCGRTG